MVSPFLSPFLGNRDTINKDDKRKDTAGRGRNMKSSNNIRTYTGIRMDPFDIQPHQVRIEDIAHALAMMVRANGHIKSFYSIAQHSINCALEAQNRGLNRRIQLACLLHDAAECYLADIPRPVKHRLAGYAEAEKRVSEAVFKALGVDPTNEEWAMVDDIDDAILYYEFEALADTQIRKSAPYISMEHNFSIKPIEETERDFLNMFNRLSEK